MHPAVAHGPRQSQINPQQAVSSSGMHHVPSDTLSAARVCCAPASASPSLGNSWPLSAPSRVLGHPPGAGSKEAVNHLPFRAPSGWMCSWLSMQVKGADTCRGGSAGQSWHSNSPESLQTFSPAAQVSGFPPVPVESQLIISCRLHAGHSHGSGEARVISPPGFSETCTAGRHPGVP